MPILKIKKSDGTFEAVPAYKGDPGVSPVVTTEGIENGRRVTITDVNGETSFDLFNGIGTDIGLLNYSEGEVRTGGLWTDGKPIYRQVLTGTAIAGLKVIGTLSDFDTIISIRGTLLRNATNAYVSIDCYASSEYCVDAAVLKNGNIRITSSHEGSVIVIVEYTKSTDESITNASSVNFVDMIYPVGSIYMSVNAADPTNLFGGTWERIKDTFLLSAGDTYEAGTTGGEAEHLLTTDEMPSHYHEPNPKTRSESSESYDYVFVTGLHLSSNSAARRKFSGGNEYWTYGTTSEDDVYQATKTTAVGGDQPHNNMPPYLTVYMWQRIA